MECSALNTDLNHKSIVSNPSCSCGAFEITSISICPRFTNIGNIYLPNNLQKPPTCAWYSFSHGNRGFIFESTRLYFKVRKICQSKIKLELRPQDTDAPA